MNHYHIYTLQKGGSGHRFCQDRYRTHRDEDRLILAVSDGHGGAPYVRSGLGARFAAAAAVAVLKDNTEQIGIPAAIKDRYDRMVKKHLKQHPLADWEALRLGDLPPHAAYGATLLAAVISPDGTDIYQLGDGDIHAIGRDGHFLPEFPGDDACFGNVTSSLCNHRAFALKHFRMLHYDVPVAALMMYSDGCDGGFLKAAHALTDLSSMDDRLQKMLRTTDHGDDQTFLLAYDPAAWEAEDFRDTLEAEVTAAREKAQKERKKQRDWAEFQELTSFLAIALRNAKRMEADHDPTLPNYLESLKPDFQRFEELRLQYTT